MENITVFDIDKLYEIFSLRYLNKKEIRYRLPSGIQISEFWPKLLEYRIKNGRELPLFDQKGNNFWYCHLPYADNLEIIDKHAKYTVNNHIDIIFKKAPKTEKFLIMDALIDEAFNSSVIEGAFSTRKRSKEIIEKGIRPTNISEQMIYNNYQALDFVMDNIHKKIDEELILEIYKLITHNTLNEEDKTEGYRSDSVIVWDYANQKQVYEGPHYSKVPKMMADLINFINNEDDLHPVEKASIIHFYFVYIHPFFDGNGRTARVLSYMYLLQHGYDFFRFFSISTVIREQKNKYYKAIQNCEEYSRDLTYFIDFNTKMILESLINVLDRLGKEFGKVLIFHNLEKRGIMLTLRQKRCLSFFIKKEKNYITIDEYQKKYKIAYETARKDLNSLEAIGVFHKTKIGKKFIYKFIGLVGLGACPLTY